MNWNHNGELELRLTAYLTRPDKLTPSRIVYLDKTAADTIARAESIIDALRAYRVNLTARYNELCTMQAHEEIKLERYPNYDGKIYYYVRTATVYEDGTRDETDNRRYTGKERREAVKYFEALCKAIPAAEHITDIARKPWER